MGIAARRFHPNIDVRLAGWCGDDSIQMGLDELVELSADARVWPLILLEKNQVILLDCCQGRSFGGLSSILPL
jgi:hypothetical protein